MRSIRSKLQEEIIVKNSRFIGILVPVSSETEAFSELSKIRENFTGANHYPYAFRISSEAQIARVSDDGEPQRTAGYPILDVIEKNNLTNVLGVVVRYFGGTLLGSSLLTRTYSKALSGLLKEDVFTVQKKMVSFELSVNYAQYAAIERYLKETVRISSITYLDVITLGILVEESMFKEIQSTLNNLLNQEVILNHLVYSELYE